MAKLTVEEIKSRYDQMTRFYRQRNENMSAWRNLYFLKEESTFFDEEGNPLPKRPEEVRVISPMPFNIVEGFRTLLLTKPPVITVPPSDSKQVSKERAQQIEDLLYILWDRANVYQEAADALWHALVDGWGCLLAYHDAEASEEETPVLVRSVDPMGVFPAPGKRRGEWAYVLTVETKAASAVKEEWLTGADGRSQVARDVRDALRDVDDDKQVQVVGYWDAEHHAAALSFAATRFSSVEWNWLLRPVKHGYGVLPWVFFFGHRLPFGDLGERFGISVLYPVEDALRYLNRLLSQKATIIARFADPTKVTKTETGRSFEWPEGDHIALHLNEDAYYLEHKGPPPQLDMQLETLMGMIEDSSLPRHMYGRYVGRLSGVGMSLLRTPVLMKIAFMQEGLERAFERLNEVMLRLVDGVVKRRHQVYGRVRDGGRELEIRPGMVGGYYRNRVKLSTSLPTDEPQIVAMLSTLLQLSVLSSQTVRDVVQQTLGDLVSQNLVEEENRIFLEKHLLNNPQIGAALALLAADKAGLDVQKVLGRLQEPVQAAPPRQNLVRMGAEAGVPAQSPLNAIQTTAPDTMEMVQRMFQEELGQMGGRPPEEPVPGEV